MPTNFEEIIFDQKYHSYTYHVKKLTSVTKLANSLKPPFDRGGRAVKTAMERGVDVATILAEWDAAGEAGRAKGVKVHELIAAKLRNELPPADDPFLSLNERLPEMDGFEKLWDWLAGMTTLQQVEWVVGDGELGVAGTVDALLLGKQSNEVHVWDWKTGKEFKSTNSFQNLLYPFDDLPDCDLSSYSLQISLYRLIIERNTDFVIGDCYIAHLDPTGSWQIYKALDLRERVESWLRER